MNVSRPSILIAILFAASAGFAAAGRLDPHGSKQLDIHSVKDFKTHSECSVCHNIEKGKLTVKEKAAETCFDCHNKAPHSGVAEHMGKLYNGEKINCLSCHAAHRSEGKSWESPGHFFGKLTEPNVQVPFRVSSKADPMLRRTCSECHKW